MLAGARLLDYGCGSGILAIAALALGAGSATGVDIDPQAVIATRDNAARNGCADRLRCGLPDEMPAEEAPVDVLVANILSGPLVRLAPVLRRCARPGTRIALSGILAGQATEVADAFRPWVSLALAGQMDGPGADRWVLLAGEVDGTRA